MKVTNKLKAIILKGVWENLKAEYTMKELADAIDIPIATFFRYVKPSK